MENIELSELWKSYDQKIDQVLTMNKEVALHISKQKINTQMNKLALPKRAVTLIGIPYTALLIAISYITFKAEAYIMTLGFGAISLIMLVVLGNFFYQLILINKIKGSDEVIAVQQQLANIKLSSFNALKLSIYQLPFWAICWISIDALKSSPLIYGGVNLFVIVGLTFLSYWIFNKFNYDKMNPEIRNTFFSGPEWEPLVISSKILDQIDEYK